MKRVLIFGCGGFDGHYLAEEFTGNGYEVIASDMVDLSERLKKSVKEYHRASLTEYTQVADIVKKANPDYVVNLAAVSSVGFSWNNPQTTIAVNVIGTLNILEAVRTAGINPRILLVGSSEEYLISEDKISENYPINANNPYGISKVTQEQFAKLYREKYGMDIFTTRTFNHTGVGQALQFVIPSFVKQVAEIHKTGKDGEVHVGNLSAIRDFGDVRDITRAYRMILESDTKERVFNVGSGKSYCIQDILEYIISLVPEKIDIVVDEEKLRPVDNKIIQCDNSLMEKEVGWKPEYTVYDSIKAMLNSFME